MAVAKKKAAAKPLCVVTGGGSLIAGGIGRALIDQGWRILLTDIDLKAAQAIAKKLGKEATAAKLDVTDLAAVQKFVTALIKKAGAPEGWINGAGGQRVLGLPHKDFVETKPKDWDKIIAVNLEGVLNCSYAVLPAMMKAKRGSIITMAASRGFRGQAGAAVHSGAKSGVIVFCQNLAVEAAPYGVRINTILPGYTPARWKKPGKNGGSRRPASIGRPTSPDDVGNLVAYLMSDKGSHIVGACLDVSGGTGLH
jgi:NAD(P)-dependent dehydrogenase (short-subunit alcohol dehydrogenase family)